MADYETGYQALSSFPEDEHETPPTENIIHVTPDNNKETRWNHVENLDDFFTRVYQYHQRSGFFGMVLQDVLQLIQFLFVVVFSVFMMKCVDYQTLFYENQGNHTHKVTLAESVYPIDKCVARFDGLLWVCIVVALIFWLLRLVKVIYNIFKYSEIRAFYIYALGISADELANLTWHEVQRQLLEVQKVQQMCIHKTDLYELDIYHRILRFKNYMIAMVNKSVLPLKHNVPFLGEYVFFSLGLKYNLEMILFWGPWSPFENYWHLKPEYRNYHKRQELAAKLSTRILYFGMGNLILCPLIFLWQILYSFFRYAELVRREPGALGSRMWSQYARLYLRHFNELDHEINARLNRGYKASKRYMEIFISPLLVIVAKHLAFLSGAVLAVFIILTVIDEDVLAVQNVIGVMTVLGVILAGCRVLIPDENMVFCPELLMRNILGDIHYMPAHWKGQAHTYKVRNEFATLFQYKAVYLLEELLSPVFAPLILIFCVRSKSMAIVDFFRNFSVEVTGVGDVCSFAQMDVRKHGNPQWVEDDISEANLCQQAENGKTELSLMHFTLTNPEWKPPTAGATFLQTLRQNVQRDAMALSSLPALDNPLVNSLSSIGYGAFTQNAMIGSMLQQSTMPVGTVSSSGLTSLHLTMASSHSSGPQISSSTQNLFRGGIKNAEGPLVGSGNGLLSSVQNTISVSASAQEASSVGGTGLQLSIGGNLPSLAPVPNLTTSQYDEGKLEMMSREMSFGALYIHELHHRRRNMPYFDPIDDSPVQQVAPHLPGIEEIDEIEMREEHPLLNLPDIDSPLLSKST